MIDLPALHVGGASAVSVIISLAGIFLLMLIMSFAFWRGPQEQRRFSGPWFRAWIRASAPRVVVAGVFCVGLFVASAFSGGGSDVSAPSVCDKSLPALTTQPVSPKRVDTGIQGLRDLAEAARSGDIDRARVLIYSDAHNITHDVDPHVRPIDRDLALDLCVTILALESEIASEDPQIGTIISEAGRSATLLEQARAIIDTATATPDPFARPGSGVCDAPVGGITAEPVTGERIADAVTKLEAVADAASVGDTTTMADLFSGDAHDITHDVDGSLRKVDPDLARQLCLSVLTLEIQLAGPYELPTIEAEASNAADLLLDARDLLEIAE